MRHEARANDFDTRNISRYNAAAIMGNAGRKKEKKHADFGAPELVGDVELEDIEAQSNDKLKKLQAELAVCQEERHAYLDGWQRAKADFLNGKKQAAAESARAHERAVVAHIEKLLPLCDSFTMAFTDSAWEEVPASWKQGIEQTHHQLLAILKDCDVEEVGAVGDAFDPSMHEAVSTEGDGQREGGENITHVLQKGYRRGERLIRAAKVVVGA